MVGLIFQKELILTKQMHEKSVILIVIGLFSKNFNYEPYLWNGFHDLMQKAIKLTAAIVSIKGSCYRIHFWYMTKDDAIKITNNSNLNEKSDYNFFLYKN